MQRRSGKGQEGAALPERWASERPKGSESRAPEGSEPLGWGPDDPVLQMQVQVSETPEAKPPALSQRPLLPRSPLGPPVLPLRLEALRFTSELAHHSTTQSNLWDKPSER